ncbi:MAG: glutamate-cysteine ligase family protein [archaeon]
MNNKNPIRFKSDIIKYFKDAHTPKHELLIGLEVERSAVFEKDLSPVQYFGSSGYLAIMKKLVEEVGWKIINRDQDGNITALKRGGSELHIEDDGRLELVSKPRKGLYGLCREYKMHTHEIDEISKEFGIRWIPMGRQPFAKNKEITFARPKYLKDFHDHYKKNYHGFQKNIFYEWEKKDNGIHVNFGYTSEKDAIEKFQTLLKMTPILVAIFANSPLNAGKFSGYLDKRFQDSILSCPKRTKIRKIFFEKDFTFEKWAEFLMNLPMRCIKRKKKNIFIPMLFRDYIKNGYQNYTATKNDLATHIQSVWNEIRIKQFIEYRSIDTVPLHLIPSVPSLIRAITLNSEVMKRCQVLVKDWTYNDHIEMREKVCKHALQAKTPDGKKVLDLAKELLEIASFTLKERHREMKDRIDSSRFLWPIKEYIFVREQSPSEYVMEMWRGEWHRNPRKLLEWSEKNPYSK